MVVLGIRQSKHRAEIVMVKLFCHIRFIILLIIKCSRMFTVCLWCEREHLNY